MTDVEQVIDVYSAYNHSFDASICDGDSVWLGFYWETEAGVYENTFNTEHGCDSNVITNISILPAVMIQLQADTCDPCLLYTSDAADERSSVDLGGRRIIKK